MSDFSLIGNISELDRLAASIAQMGQRSFQREMLSEMADEALDLVHDEFAASHDPQGSHWAPLKKPRFGAGPLVKTGALQGSVRKKVTPEGFVLYTLRKYAPFHQYGTKAITARPFFPVGTPPAEWLTKFDAIAEAHVRRLIGGASRAA